MSFDIMASQKDQTLPMVLTLRGDETIVDEFNYDSEQAMSFLGIKRSRLNQISGRELRVARVRRDRYIRPVYRESDLKDYLEWTRATATHMSSSKAIEQAVENLDDRFNDVLQVFNEKLDQVADAQQAFMKSEFERLPTRFPSPSPLSSPVDRDEDPRPLMQSEKVLRRHGEQLVALSQDLQRAMDKIEGVQGTLGIVIPEFRELSVGQKSLRFDVDQKFMQLSSMLMGVTELLGDLQRQQDELALKLHAAIENLSLGDDHVEVSTPRRNRKVKARGYFR